MKSLRRILRIPWHAYKTNEYVMQLAEELAGPIEPALLTIKKRKLQWFGHVVRHQTLAKTILLGWVSGSRKVGRQKTMWQDNILKWTGKTLEEAIRTAEDREHWRRTIASSVKLPDVPLRGTRVE